MRTVVNDPPQVLRDWLDDRRGQGQDLHDEIWEGVYHAAPAPHPSHAHVDDELAALLRPYAVTAGLRGAGPLNVGSPDDYRVPDRSYTRHEADTTFVASVAIAVEIVSPGDETRDKLEFYFRHRVEELLIVDPRHQTVQWFTRGDEEFQEAEASRLLSMTAAELRQAIEWPTTPEGDGPAGDVDDSVPG